MQIIEADGVPAQPWRNGGGATRELYTWPSAADWQLRISLADIGQDGPFSAFPGVRRWFAVIEGDGVELEFAAGPRQLRAGEAPIAFDGTEAPGCRLLAGPTCDLNLMLRDAEGEASMRWLAVGEAWQPSPGKSALFAPRTTGLHRADGLALELPARSLALLDSELPLRVEAAVLALSWKLPGA